MPKNCRKLLIFLYEMYLIIQVIFNFSPNFCVSQRKHIWVPWLKVVIEPIAGVNEAKIWPNFAKMCYIAIQKQPNTNATPLMSLDNSSTLTISDLFVAHSCFQPVDPKNGLKLFFLLSLCSLSSFCGGWRWTYSCL